jgi:hypothetical protein
MSFLSTIAERAISCAERLAGRRVAIKKADITNVLKMVILRKILFIITSRFPDGSLICLFSDSPVFYTFPCFPGDCSATAQPPLLSSVRTVQQILLQNPHLFLCQLPLQPPVEYQFHPASHPPDQTTFPVYPFVHLPVYPSPVFHLFDQYHTGLPASVLFDPAAFAAALFF